MDRRQFSCGIAASFILAGRGEWVFGASDGQVTASETCSTSQVEEHFGEAYRATTHLAPLTGIA
jgi:hypothetical protein